jgi:hypothetical protein
MPQRVGSKKMKVYRSIMAQASLLGQPSQGFEHRIHRSKKTNNKTINRKKEYIAEERELEWDKLKKKINFIGDEY